MRAQTLFAVVLATFLIHYSEAANRDTLNKRMEPVDGILKKRAGLPLVGDLLGGGGGGGGHGGGDHHGDRDDRGRGGDDRGRGGDDRGRGGDDNRGEFAAYGVNPGYAADYAGYNGYIGDFDNDHFVYDSDFFDDEFTKRSTMEERNLLSGLLGGIGGGGGHGHKDDDLESVSASTGPASKQTSQDTNAARPADDSSDGGLPIIGSLLKRDLLGGLLGGSSSHGEVKQAASDDEDLARGFTNKANKKNVKPAASHIDSDLLDNIGTLLR